MDDWVDQLASALDVAPLSEVERRKLLDVARDVAHGVERKITPLAAFVLGSAVGQATSAGAQRSAALADAIARARGLLPPDAAPLEAEGGTGDTPAAT